MGRRVWLASAGAGGGFGAGKETAAESAGSQLAELLLLQELSSLSQWWSMRLGMLAQSSPAFCSLSSGQLMRSSGKLKMTRSCKGQGGGAAGRSVLFGVKTGSGKMKIGDQDTLCVSVC